MADLKGLASECKFEALQDEMIRDQLILHMNYDRIRDKLLLENDDLTLAQDLKIALAGRVCSGMRGQSVLSHLADPE